MSLPKKSTHFLIRFLLSSQLKFHTIFHPIHLAHTPVRWFLVKYFFYFTTWAHLFFLATTNSQRRDWDEKVLKRHKEFPFLTSTLVNPMISAGFLAQLAGEFVYLAIWWAFPWSIFFLARREKKNHPNSTKHSSTFGRNSTTRRVVNGGHTTICLLHV